LARLLKDQQPRSPVAKRDLANIDPVSEQV
jgi:hypothetical protein